MGGGALRAAKSGGGEACGSFMVSFVVDMRAIAMLKVCRFTLPTGDGSGAIVTVLRHGEEDDVVDVGISRGSRSSAVGAGRGYCCSHMNALRLLVKKIGDIAESTAACLMATYIPSPGESAIVGTASLLSISTNVDRRACIGTRRAG